MLQRIRCFFLSYDLINTGLLLFIFILALRSLIPLTMSGFPVTHDGEAHVARAANYAVAIRQGHFPPRIAPTFANGYGYPVFNFHYPLLNILSAPLILIGLHPEIAVKFWVLFFWIAFWVGSYLLCKEVTRNTTSSLVGLSVLLLSPYWYSLVYVRGAYGELLAIATIVWFLFLVEKNRKLKEENKYLNLIRITVGTFLLLAHNIYAVLFFPILSLYSLYRLGKSKYLQTFFELFLSGGLSTFFWFPAVFEKKYVVYESKFSAFYLDHFLSFNQLFNSKVTPGFSTKGDADTLSYGIGIAAVVVFAVATYYCWYSLLKKRKVQKRIYFLLLSVVVTLFLVLPISQPIWKYSFILPYLQFPWRLLGPLAVIIMLTTSLIWTHIAKELRITILFACLSASMFVFSWYLPPRDHNMPDYYLNYRQNTMLLDELRPITFTVDPGKLSPQLPVVIGTGSYEIKKWRNTYREYEISAQESVTVVEPTMFFPGWQVYANGKLVPVDKTLEYEGQVAYSLPKGEWHIRSAITQKTEARLLGNGTTVLSVIILTIYMIPRKIQKNKP